MPLNLLILSSDHQQECSTVNSSLCVLPLFPAPVLLFTTSVRELIKNNWGGVWGCDRIPLPTPSEIKYPLHRWPNCLAPQRLALLLKKICLTTALEQACSFTQIWQQWFMKALNSFPHLFLGSVFYLCTVPCVLPAQMFVQMGREWGHGIDLVGKKWEPKEPRKPPSQTKQKTNKTHSQKWLQNCQIGSHSLRMHTSCYASFIQTHICLGQNENGSSRILGQQICFSSPAP